MQICAVTGTRGGATAAGRPFMLPSLYPLGRASRATSSSPIAATNRIFQAEVAAGRFRRTCSSVSVTTLRHPALRERKEDIASCRALHREMSHTPRRIRETLEANVIDAFEDTHGRKRTPKCERGRSMSC